MDGKTEWNRDRSEQFEEEARPLLEELCKVLERNQIPYFFSACVSNIEDTEGRRVQKYVRVAKTPAAYGRTISQNDDEKNHHYNKAYHDGSLYADEISRHFAVSLGAEVRANENETLDDLGMKMIDVSDDLVEDEP